MQVRLQSRKVKSFFGITTSSPHALAASMSAHTLLGSYSFSQLPISAVIFFRLGVSLLSSVLNVTRINQSSWSISLIASQIAASTARRLVTGPSRADTTVQSTYIDSAPRVTRKSGLVSTPSSLG